MDHRIFIWGATRDVSVRGGVRKWMKKFGDWFNLEILGGAGLGLKIC